MFILVLCLTFSR